MPVIVHELYYPDMRQRGPPPDPKESNQWRNLFYHEIHPQGGARPTPDKPKRVGDRGRLVSGHPNEGVWDLCTDGDFRMVATHLVHRVEVFGCVHNSCGFSQRLDEGFWAMDGCIYPTASPTTMMCASTHLMHFSRMTALCWQNRRGAGDAGTGAQLRDD
jgi:hypothetical protein